MFKCLKLTFAWDDQTGFPVFNGMGPEETLNITFSKYLWMSLCFLENIYTAHAYTSAAFDGCRTVLAVTQSLQSTYVRAKTMVPVSGVTPFIFQDKLFHARGLLKNPTKKALSEKTKHVYSDSGWKESIARPKHLSQEEEGWDGESLLCSYQLNETNWGIFPLHFCFQFLLEKENVCLPPKFIRPLNIL